MIFNPQIIELFISLTEKKYNKVFTDYKELSKVISKDFKIQITEKDIWNYYEPGIEEEDKRIHNKSLNIHY